MGLGEHLLKTAEESSVTAAIAVVTFATNSPKTLRCPDKQKVQT